MYSGIQSLACPVERGRVVPPGVVTSEGRVLGDEDQEVRVAIDVKERELIAFNEEVCE